MTDKPMTGLDYQKLYDQARQAGIKAGHDCQPQEMIVLDHANKTRYHVPQGVCGFAWVNVKDRRFNNFLKKQGLGDKDSYYGGRTIWIGEYGQSHARKVAHARAMAKTLRDGGVAKCYAGDRLD